MKILVFLHELVVGGTIVNCIELSAALRDLHGHEVVLFATPGPMLKWVRDARLRFVAAPVAACHPSPARMRALREVVQAEKPDLIHVWETWPCLDAYCAAYLAMGIPLLITNMQMSVTRISPKRLVTTYGTPELAELARAAGRPHTEVLVPPVDVRLNAPGAVDATAFAQRFGIEPGDTTLVTVSRLVESLKGESLLRTIDAMRTLGRQTMAGRRLRLLIVGDGTARGAVAQRAAETNAELRRDAVVLTGALHDPRPAYAAADIVVGMGGSALRALAFAKPVVVVGEQAFSAAFTTDTAAMFHHTGLYGIGDGDPACTRLVADIAGVAERPRDWAALGATSRQFVVAHFCLDVVAASLSAICTRAAAQPVRGLHAVPDALRTAAVYLRERRFMWRGVPPLHMDSSDALEAHAAPLPDGHG